MVDWSKDTAPQGENARARQGRSLVQLIEALEVQILYGGRSSLSDDVLAVLDQCAPISCSECLVPGHWADDCPRKVVNV